MKKLFRFPILDFRSTISRLRALRDHDCRFPIPDFRFTVSRHRALREAESEFPAPVLWFAKYSFSVFAYGACLAFLAALLFLSCGR